MANPFVFFFVSILYRWAFPIYKFLYWNFKSRQDKYEIELMKKWIKPGDTVLDIGANIGFYADHLSQITGTKGKVHCFEPDINNFKHLKSITSKRKNIIINNMAVSNNNEPLKLYTSKQINVDHRTYPVDSHSVAYEVACTSIDNYMAGTQVDFIKMDIQGAELNALKGMEQTLRQNDKIKIIMELWPYGLSNAKSTINEVINFIFSLDFKIFVIEKNNIELFDSSNSDKYFKNKDENDFINIVLSKEDL